eukprot:237619-Amphidinium_carterae.1
MAAAPKQQPPNQSSPLVLYQLLRNVRDTVCQVLVNISNDPFAETASDRGCILFHVGVLFENCDSMNV